MIYVNQYQNENVFLDLSLSHFYKSIQNHKKKDGRERFLNLGHLLIAPSPHRERERGREQVEMEEIVNSKLDTTGPN